MSAAQVAWHGHAMSVDQLRAVVAPSPLDAYRKSKVQAASEASGLGLVPSTTSAPARIKFNSRDVVLGITPLSETGAIEIDRNAVRAKRLKKSVITGARLHDQEAHEGSSRGGWYMLTTTYAPGRTASPRDISGLLERIRGHFGRNNRQGRQRRARVRYLWVLELTVSLRPHYHVLIWVPKGSYIPHVDRAGWWPHGLTKFEKARNAVGYLAKYASKFCAAAAEALPKGFRTHAVGGLNTESRRELRWWRSPLEAREALGLLADIRKTLGGYADKTTGAYWPSPWKVVLSNGRVFAIRIETL